MTLIPEAKSQLQRAVLFGLLLSWCGALLIFRFTWTDSLNFSFLAWNLILAVVPLVAAVFFARTLDRCGPVWQRWCWFAIWLVFLPNAPYILTDFMHLHRRSAMPMWYDVALLASCAGTGLLLGYASLAEVQAAVTRRWSAPIGWILAVITLFLSGFGIYLGRFLRWNSWQIVSKPFGLLADVVTRGIDPFAHPRTLGVTLVYGMILFLGYVALRLFQPSTPIVPVEQKSLGRNSPLDK